MRLTWQEGLALEVLGAMLGRGTLPRLEDFEAPASIRPVLARALAERIVRRCLQELVHQGGGRSRTILRSGQRMDMRLWDGEAEGATDAFDFRFTETSTRFAGRAVRQLPALALSWQLSQDRARSQNGQAGQSRTGKRQLKEMLIPEGSAPGDWLFLALVQGNLERMALAPEVLDALESRLRQCSPLAFLLALGGSGIPEDVPARLALLLAPSAVRLVECLDGLFVKRWAAVLGRALRPQTLREAHEVFVRRWAVISLVHRSWVALLEQEKRLDLARPLLVSLRDLVEGPLAQRTDLRMTMGQRAGARSVHQVEEAAAAFADWLAVSEQLGQLRDQMSAYRYGDERYPEAQLFLRDHDELLAPRGEEIRGILRQLRGTLG